MVLNSPLLGVPPQSLFRDARAMICERPPQHIKALYIKELDSQLSLRHSSDPKHLSMAPWHWCCFYISSGGIRKQQLSHQPFFCFGMLLHSGLCSRSSIAGSPVVQLCLGLVPLGHFSGEEEQQCSVNAQAHVLHNVTCMWRTPILHVQITQENVICIYHCTYCASECASTMSSSTLCPLIEAAEEFE